MKIPKKFKLFNHEIIVKMSKELHKNDDLWGTVRYRIKEIIIDENISQSYKEQTFLHELIHLIFTFMCEKELSGNEKLVNTISELLYQALETMEY